MNHSVYQIRNKKTNQSYIGSCVCTIKQRLHAHRWHFNKGISTCSSKELFIDANDNDIEVILLEQLPENSTKIDRLKIEERYRTTIPCVNKKRTFLDKTLVECSCGRSIRSYRMKDHQSTKLHTTKFVPELKGLSYKEKKELIQPIICLCGRSIRPYRIEEHMSTKLHKTKFVPELKGLLYKERGIPKIDCSCGHSFIEARKEDHLKTNFHLKHAVI